MLRKGSGPKLMWVGRLECIIDERPATLMFQDRKVSIHLSAFRDAFHIARVSSKKFVAIVNRSFGPLEVKIGNWPRFRINSTVMRLASVFSPI